MSTDDHDPSAAGDRVSPAAPLEQPATARPRPGDIPLGCGFWANVWLGTALAGGVLGLLLGVVGTFVAMSSGSPHGVVLLFIAPIWGFLTAGFVAIPAVLLIASTAWLLRLWRYRLLLAGAVGALSGLVIVLPGLLVTGSMAASGSIVSAWLGAGLLGALGAAGSVWGARWHQRRRRAQWEAFDADPRNRQFSIRRLLGAFVLVALVLGGLRALLDTVERARCVLLNHQFAGIAQALHHYHAKTGLLPHPVRRAGSGSDLVPRGHDPEAEPLYSWRLNLLSLYFGIDHDADLAYDKPWNDPSQQSAAWGTGVYSFDDESWASDQTNVVAITGPGTAFGDGARELPRSLHDVDDDTILLVEVRRSGIPWRAPGDLDLRTMPPTIDRADGRGISGCRAYGFHVVFADGAVWILSHRTPFDELRKFFTVEAARRYDRDEVLKPYRVGQWQEPLGGAAE